MALESVHDCQSGSATGSGPALWLDMNITDGHNIGRYSEYSWKKARTVHYRNLFSATHPSPCPHQRNIIFSARAYHKACPRSYTTQGSCTTAFPTITESKNAQIWMLCAL